MTLRADAQRNHDRVLVVAGECFAERGLDVSIDEIAKRAGVGHGTVFRRFPTKDALVAAVLDEQIRQLNDAAQTALGLRLDHRDVPLAQEREHDDEGRGDQGTRAGEGVVEAVDLRRRRLPGRVPHRNRREDCEPQRPADLLRRVEEA